MIKLWFIVARNYQSPIAFQREIHFNKANTNEIIYVAKVEKTGKIEYTISRVDKWTEFEFKFFWYFNSKHLAKEPQNINAITVILR